MVTYGNQKIFRSPMTDQQLLSTFPISSWTPLPVAAYSCRQGPWTVDLRTPPGPEGSNGSLLCSCRGHPGTIELRMRSAECEMKLRNHLLDLGFNSVLCILCRRDQLGIVMRNLYTT